jgi:lysophospholipase L1-like esterase
MRRFVGSVALIIVGVMLGLAVLEGGLQIGALWLRASGQKLRTTWSTTSHRILFVGDSNTYGLYLDDRTLAFPDRLAAIWNEDSDLPPVEAINLGYPGTNSWRIRRELPRMLEELRPEIVVVMVGVNDAWTLRLPVEEPPGFWRRAIELVKRHSRVYLLAHLLRQSLAAPSVQYTSEPVRTAFGLAGEKVTMRIRGAEFSMGWRTGPATANYERNLELNLKQIAETCRRFGATPVLATYPSEAASYGTANKHIRRAAVRIPAPLVDTHSAFARFCPREPCPEYLYADHHPTVRGHEIVAGMLKQRLLYVGPLARLAQAE